MANNLLSFVLLHLCLSLFISSSAAEVICEKLPRDVCSFAVSSTSNRCILESSNDKQVGEMEYQCKTSDVTVQRLSDYIESDQCIESCGVERNTVGISSDSLLDPMFTSKLCSANCYQNCSNIVDLYFNLAAGEGVLLSELCEANRMNPHRAMAELLSSGEAQAPETSGEELGPASSVLSSGEPQAPETSGEELAPASSVLSSGEPQAPETSGEELAPASSVLSSGEPQAPETSGEELAPASSVLSSGEPQAPESSGEELGPASSVLSSGEPQAPESSGEELGPTSSVVAMAPSSPLPFDLFTPPAASPSA